MIHFLFPLFLYSSSALNCSMLDSAHAEVNSTLK